MVECAVFPSVNEACRKTDGKVRRMLHSDESQKMSQNAEYHGAPAVSIAFREKQGQENQDSPAMRMRANKTI